MLTSSELPIKLPQSPGVCDSNGLGGGYLYLGLGPARWVSCFCKFFIEVSHIERSVSIVSTQLGEFSQTEHG